MLKHFDAQEELRERALEASRAAVRASARAIAATHRGDQDAAGKFLAEAKTAINALAKVIETEPQMADSGIALSAQQEYAEAELVKALLKDSKISGPEELGVPYKAYLAALADAAGELRRHVLDSIRANEIERAEKMLKLMEEIFELLMEFDYPDAVLPGMRRRQDMVRNVIERTRGDLTIALRQQRLERALGRGGK